MPIEAETNIAITIDAGSTLEGMDVTAETIPARENPKRIPINPPIVDKVADSIKN